MNSIPQIVPFEKPKVQGADPDAFIRTEAAEDILRSNALVRSINRPAITMISGAPGIGKTETLRHWQRDKGGEVITLSIAKGEGNPSHVAGAILRKFGCYKKDGNCLSAQRSQVGRYIGANRILLVDEARNLYQRHKASCTKGSGFEWLVAASAEGGFDPAFCGDLTLHAILAEFPHLQSRVRRPVVIKAVAPADVAALARAEDIDGPAEIALLTAIAALPGGLRNVENAIRMAALFAGRNRITGPHIKAAIVDLKLQPRGGK